MKKEPVLVILAAGMGSRYGGLKQIDPMDKEGHIIIDFSIFDAVKAGFKKVIFIIKEKDKDAFEEAIGQRIREFIEVEYAFQDLTDVPEGFVIPEGREKPWGTSHAIYSCRDKIDGPFAVINADDYYGQSAYQTLYDFLSQVDDDSHNYQLVGYVLENTLTDHGSVSRGVCVVDEEGYLKEITERTKIQKMEGKVVFEDDGQWVEVDPKSTASMNMWGFTSKIIEQIGKRLDTFFAEEVALNPLKSESFLPEFVGSFVRNGSAKVQVNQSQDKWYGVTYKEDKEHVVSSIQALKDSGVYPQHLWKD